MPIAETKISIRGLTKQFMVHGRTFDALSEVDLDVCAGEFFCIVGPSGCGKTTLLRIVAGLEESTAGTIKVNSSGGGAKGKADRPVNSMVFQEQSIFPWMTVRDNVAFGLKAQGLSKQSRYEIANAYIEKVGLHGFADALPHQLSGGMKQRVSIARAFATDPEILLMDEPFAALDEQTKLILQDELVDIWEGTQKTVIYVTHSIDEAIVLADRILVMSARPGKIKEIVDVAAVFDRPRHVQTVKSSKEFGGLFGHIWELLRNEVIATETANAGA